MGGRLPKETWQRCDYQPVGVMRTTVRVAIHPGSGATNQLVTNLQLSSIKHESIGIRDPALGQVI